MKNCCALAERLHPSFLQRTAPIACCFCESLHLALSSHPDHMTILLRSQSPSGKRAKLHTDSKQQWRSHAVIAQLQCCLFAPLIYIYVLFLGHMPFRGASRIRHRAGREATTANWTFVPKTLHQFLT